MEEFPQWKFLGANTHAKADNESLLLRAGNQEQHVGLCCLFLNNNFNPIRSIWSDSGLVSYFEKIPMAELVLNRSLVQFSSLYLCLRFLPLRYI